ncbi:MAG: metallophosphoesterase family protein, partial [Chloroflexota bacterium]
VFEMQGRRIGVIHPEWGGPPWGIEEEIAKEFDGVDIILYGHTHDISHQTIGDTIFLNPGQAYSSFRIPASAARITIDAEQLEIEIHTYD